MTTTTTKTTKTRTRSRIKVKASKSGLERLELVLDGGWSPPSSPSADSVAEDAAPRGEDRRGDGYYDRRDDDRDDDDDARLDSWRLEDDHFRQGGLDAAHSESTCETDNRASSCSLSRAGSLEIGAMSTWDEDSFRGDVGDAMSGAIVVGGGGGTSTARIGDRRLPRVVVVATRTSPGSLARTTTMTVRSPRPVTTKGRSSRRIATTATAHTVQTSSSTEPKWISILE